MSSSLHYHLRELDTALDPGDPNHCLPEVRQDERDVLDIGCGVGQLFVAQSARRPAGMRVGLDVEQAPLAYAARHFPTAAFFVRARAESLPLRAASFDLVVARVSLPYTNLPRALDEIHRVLRPGGRVWLSLHPMAMTWRELGAALRDGRLKDVVFRCYVLANGALLHACGRVWPFTNGRRESFQTEGGMRRALRAKGFTEILIKRDRHFVVDARRLGSTE